ncbi:MAG: hypothetical protein FJX59_10795 [Alphaproteobacteria bacterium]|nr:hypothetical protein [Alphaproteobacteria bacterium]
MEKIQSLVYEHLPPERFKFYPGWFEQTLPTLNPQIKFALVHIDCDLYESTRTVLNELFGLNRLSDGCIILLDDYLLNRGAKRFGQRKAWDECRKLYSPDLTDWGPYGLSSWRFIYHAQ